MTGIDLSLTLEKLPVEAALQQYRDAQLKPVSEQFSVYQESGLHDEKLVESHNGWEDPGLRKIYASVREAHNFNRDAPEVEAAYLRYAFSSSRRAYVLTVGPDGGTLTYFFRTGGDEMTLLKITCSSLAFLHEVFAQTRIGAALWESLKRRDLSSVKVEARGFVAPDAGDIILKLAMHPLPPVEGVRVLDEIAAMEEQSFEHMRKCLISYGYRLP